MKTVDAERLSREVGIGCFPIWPTPLFRIMKESANRFPGMQLVVGREYAFLECNSVSDFRKLFSKITKFGSSSLPTSGGAINEECVVEIPTGQRLYGLSYRGDICGWRRKVIECADVNKILWGKIVDRTLQLSDGEKIDLINCKLELLSP